MNVRAARAAYDFAGNSASLQRSGGCTEYGLKIAGQGPPGETLNCEGHRLALLLLKYPAFDTRDVAARRKTAALFAWWDKSDIMRFKFDALRAVAQTLLYTLAYVALTTAVVALAVEYTALEFDLIIYLVPVVISAVRFGRAAAIVAVLASATVADFLWIPPFYSLTIADPKHVLELILFVFVALVTGDLAVRLRRGADALQRRDHEIHNLYEFSRRLALSDTTGDLLKAIRDYLSAHLGSEAHLIHLGAPFVGDDPAADAPVPLSVAREANTMVMAREPSARLIAEPNTGSLWALKYVATTAAGHGVLAINLGTAGGADIGELNARINASLSKADATLMRIDAAAALAKATMRLESDVLKTALINTASHELRSPVAAILGSASVLDQVPALRDNDELRALVGGMHDEAARLDSDIRNLLDTVRITESGVTPRRSLTDLTDVLGAAMRQRQRRTAGHKLAVDIDPTLPLVTIDPALLEQAIGQLVENAVKYSPPGSDIAISGRTEDGQVVLSITDQGAGLTEEEAENLFHRAYRGRRHVGNVPGLGLGLWIARIFVAANGGTLVAHSAGPGRGTTMSIRLPIPATSAS
jgi:K+-sensing histidine kinase KdpD